MSNINDVRRRAMDLLGMREHAFVELSNKLIQKGFERTQVDEVVRQLRTENLQSDERYVESFVRSRSAKGFGPLKIRLELAHKGVDEHNINQHLATLTAEFWREVLTRAWDKKYGNELDSSVKAKAKCVRYLQYKGFALDDIYSVINEKANS